MGVASLRLRLLAALVDAAAVIGGMAAVVGLGIAGAVIYGRVRGDQDEPEDDEEDKPDCDEQDDQSDIHFATRESQSPALSAALSGASAGLAVAGRNWRGPGFRVVGLRRVDAQTRESVSVRSALIGVSFDQAFQAATGPLFGSRVQRQRNRISALKPQLRGVEREYTDDPRARQRAVMELYKANDVRPFAGCGWQLAGSVGSQLILAIGARGGRTVRDRITGTDVIVDR